MSIAIPDVVTRRPVSKGDTRWRGPTSLIVVALIAAACGTDGTTDTNNTRNSGGLADESTTSSVTTTTADPVTTTTADPARSRNWWLDPLLRVAHIVVEGTVVSIDGPYFNSQSGQSDAQDFDGIQRRRTLYREVTLSVDQVIYDELGLGSHPSIRVVVEGGGDPNAAFDDVGPILTVGERVVFILQWRGHLLAEGYADILIVHFREYGVMKETSPGVYVQARAGNPGYVFGVGDHVTDRYPDGVPVSELRALIEALKAVPAAQVLSGVARWGDVSSDIPFPLDGDFSLSPSG